MEIEQVFEQVRQDPSELDEAGLTAAMKACAHVRCFADAQEARLLSEVRKRRAGTDGAKVLKDIAGVSGREARKRAKLARELERLPRVADGLANGDLNFEQAALVAETHSELPKEAEIHEAELVDMASETSPDRLRHELQAWRNQQRPDDGEAEFETKRRKRSVTMFDTEDGLFGLFAGLDPMAGDEVKKAVEFHANRLWRAARNSDTDTPIPLSKRPQLFADALLDMARRSMQPGDAGGSNDSAPPHASVVAVISIEWLLGRLDLDGFCELADGTPIPVTVVRQLAAQVGVIPLVMDTDGTILDMGRRSRTATDDQKLALLVRDGACAFPDCDSADPAFTHAHHIDEWTEGGATDLENLLNVCMCDHHRIHAVRPSASLTESRLRRNIAAAGWSIQQHEDHAWWLHRPDGEPHRSLRRRRPPPDT